MTISELNDLLRQVHLGSKTPDHALRRIVKWKERGSIIWLVLVILLTAGLAVCLERIAYISNQTLK